MTGDTNEPTNIKVQLTDSQGEAENLGNQFYAIKRTNITTSSVNIAFGFTAKMIILETDPANDADIAVDWNGGTAVVPSANTAGDDLVSADRIITLDKFYVSSISVIAVSGTQTVTVRAFR